MSSKADARSGRQRPRLSFVPEWEYTDGPDAAELASSYGLTPLPWQAPVLDAWLGRDADDRFSSPTCGIAVPRQNGKNAIVEMYELYLLACTGASILHTAHEVKTARKAFLRLAAFFDDERNHPELHDLLVPNGIRRTNGQESITLRNGGSIEYSARSRGANRGYTVDIVIFDEAQELTSEQLSAIMYALAAAPTGNRQIVYLGTPPGDRSPGDVFANVRDQALDGEPRICWHEWSVEEIGDVSDRDRWYEANPSLGYLITEEWVENELVNSAGHDSEFARERLGWWATSSERAAISSKRWAKLATADPPKDGTVSYGIRFSPDGAWYSLAVCLKPEDAPPHVELIEHRSTKHGMDDLCRWLVERKDQAAVYVVDGKSQRDELIAQLREARVPTKAILAMSVKDVIASTVRFSNAVDAGRLTHYAQPALDRCVELSRTRPIGSDGGWGWRCAKDEDSTPLEAVSQAYYGAMTTKRKPGRKVRLL